MSGSKEWEESDEDGDLHVGGIDLIGVLSVGVERLI